MTRQHLVDALSWPARRWLMDRLCGHHAYTKNTTTVAPGDLLRNEHTGEVWMIGQPTRSRTPVEFGFVPRSPQETA